MGRLVFLSFLLILAVPAAASTSASDATDTVEVLETLRALPPMEMDEVMWLARCLLSESDRAHEQRLVAWVVRNRVETRYRGYTYREVVLEPLQFSAFNRPSPRRTYLLSLDQYATQASWHSALKVALDVYGAAGQERPFPVSVRHFYSPVSMQGRSEPIWAEGREPLSSERLGVDSNRFLFFDHIEPHFEDTPNTEIELAHERLQDGPSGSSIRIRRPRLKMGGTVARPKRPTVERPSL